MAAERRADVTWKGDLKSGEGMIDSVGSGVFGGLGVSWPARTEEPNGKTSPEELIAAAHASCFAMQLSSTLAKGGTPPEQLRTSAAVTFIPGEGITRIVLGVTGRVPGLDEEGFIEAAEDAKANCPVSKALAAVEDISVDASLESPVEHRDD
jgi:osmotically inducible protein OsmC